MKEAEKEVVIPVAESAGTVLKNLYDGKTYTVSADRNVSVTIPAAKDGGTIVLTAETKTEPAPDEKQDDKKTDTAESNGNAQSSGNNANQSTSANIQTLLNRAASGCSSGKKITKRKTPVLIASIRDGR